MSMYCASCTFDREYLLYVCTGDVYGEEAIAKYSADPESMRFDCCYIGGVAKMTIEGNVISGVDAEGNEIFRHAYASVEVENNENGFIFYKTEDENAGQFTYFAFGGDTMAETFHLEFRYAEDLADLISAEHAHFNALLRGIVVHGCHHRHVLQLQFIRQRVFHHDQQINIALLRLKAAHGRRAVQIHARQAIAQNGPGLSDKGVQQALQFHSFFLPTLLCVLIRNQNMAGRKQRGRSDQRN